MSYTLIAFLVSFGTIFGLAFIGSLLIGKNIGRTALIGLICSIVYGLLLMWALWAGAVGVYGPSPLFWSILLGSIIGFIVGGCSDDDWSNIGALPGYIVSGGYIVYILIFVLIFGQGDAFHAPKKAQLIGKVEVISDLSEVLEPADPSHICLVSESMARVKANAALSKFKVNGDVIAGSRYSIGDGTKQYVDGQLWWVFPLEFQSYFKWKQEKQVPGYLRVSAENPFEDAQSVQYNKQGEEIHIRYLKSACWEYRADRYLRHNGYASKIITDWTFEPDDNWNPYYTLSVIKRTTGYSGYVFEGIIIFDLQSGEFEYKNKDEIPEWVDRGIPLDVLDYQIKKWGEYSKAGWWYVLWHNDKSQQPTPGWYITFGADGQCKWFSGFTSKSTDNALTGFTLSDAKTGKTVFFKASGVTENIAYATAKSLWSNFAGYGPAELAVYNIYGQLTYVIPMEYQGQFKGVSLVSMKNVDINGKGTSLEGALSNYRSSMAKSGSDVLSPSGGKLQELELSGKIERVGMPMIQGQQQVFPFTISGETKVFQASYSYSMPEVPLMQNGDWVTITFMETQEKVITCNSFDLSAVKLTEESSVQARYYENRDEVEKETSRVKQIEKRTQLLESDQLKNVDPKALEEFLKQQKQNQQ